MVLEQLIVPREWDAFIKNYRDAHILQTSTWGNFKSGFGWKPHYVQYGGLGALILFKEITLSLSVGYIPRGPIGRGSWLEFWPQVDQLCKLERTVFLRVEPDIWEPVSADFKQSHLPGFIQTNYTVQPQRTIMIDLQGPDEEILMQMKPKTRYNIRLAQKKGIVVRQTDEIHTFHQIMLTTGERDGFGVHSFDYYQQAYDLFNEQGACILLIAEFNEQPLAGLMAFARGKTAWYFYGASTNEERNRMPTYLLQWEAMRWAKQKGCLRYDLWGVPDYPEAELEEGFLNRTDDLWGVYRFKRGFGGTLQRTVGTWDRVYMPLLYRVYQYYAKRQQAPAGA